MPSDTPARARRRMITAGIWLIYAGVAIRVLVRFAGLPQVGLVAAGLALYGLLLLVEPWAVEQRALPRLLAGAPRSGGPDGGSRREGLTVLYLFVQSSLIVSLFHVPPHLDFFAGLFIPLSLQAVFFFGRRLGFVCIAFFPIVMFGPLTGNDKGWPFALAMSLFAGGLCFLLGSYAHQVQKAEAARRHNQRLLGELQAANRQLQSYAAQASDLSAEQERGRLARELHDSVTQTVFSMNLTVQSARLLLEQDRGRAVHQFERLEELAASAMGEIQALVSQLRPPSLAEEGLPAALRRLAIERQVRDGLQVTVEVHGERALPEPVAGGLYGIAQEALANAAKHAGTGQAVVRLDLGAGVGCLEIEDDGRGFDPQAPFDRPGHLGLAGMAERAREMGWSLAIDSGPDAGTRIRVQENRPEGGR